MTTEHTETFLEHRSLLFGIAYRMLGTAMDAEDMVQETFLRWQRTDLAEVESPRAFLTTVITRLCIDHLRSARIQRESYIGPWLPEPLLTADTAGPATSVSLTESITMAFLIMLEKLSPAERAAFLLREIFGYDYADLARILERSQAATRQLVSRAGRKLERDGGDRSPAAGPGKRPSRLTEQFLAAAGGGDMEGLLNLLAPDATIWSDGGGKAAAARRPIHGAEKVAAFFLGLARQAPAGAVGWFTEINGESGFVLYEDGRATTVLVPHVVDGRIHAVYAMRNPDKLQRLPPLSRLDEASLVHFSGSK